MLRKGAGPGVITAACGALSLPGLDRFDEAGSQRRGLARTGASDDDHERCGPDGLEKLGNEVVAAEEPVGVVELIAGQSLVRASRGRNIVQFRGLSEDRRLEALQLGRGIDPQRFPQGRPSPLKGRNASL